MGGASPLSPPPPHIQMCARARLKFGEEGGVPSQHIRVTQGWLHYHTSELSWSPVQALCEANGM